MGERKRTRKRKRKEEERVGGGAVSLIERKGEKGSARGVVVPKS